MLLIGALAETAGRCGWPDPQVLPPLSTVLIQAARLAADREFVAAATATLGMWGAGLLTGTLAAVSASILLTAAPHLEVITRPLLELLRAVPIVALIPLALLVLGGSTQMSVAAIAYAAGWPVFVHALHGLHAADLLARQTLQTYGFGPVAVAWRVALPSALPWIATGVRIAAAIGLAVAVSAELLAGGGPGIGTWLIGMSGSTDQTSMMLAAAIWVGTVSLLCDATLTRATHRLLPWHRQVAGGTGAFTPRRSPITDQIARVLLLAGLVAVWEILTRTAGEGYFPPPSQICARMRDLWFSGPPTHAWLSAEAVANVTPSLFRLLAAWLLAALAGTAIGLALGRITVLARCLEPTIHLLRAIPPPLLVPVWLALIPLGTPTMMAAIIFGVLWPVALAAADGARSINLVQHDTARVFQLPAHQRLLSLIIPAALPKICAGLRMSLSLALILMVVAELLGGATTGIGVTLLLAQRTYDLPAMWGCTIALGAIGIALNAVMHAVQHRALARHGPITGAA
ncbi:ABC transporter permease [Actinomadura geliboluensis]|uniref:ABC transporter permease n=1 Tax=Actinomadura geliboluensis TaxID=882440 RepID=UPI00371473FE